MVSVFILNFHEILVFVYELSGYGLAVRGRRDVKSLKPWVKSRLANLRQTSAFENTLGLLRLINILNQLLFMSILRMQKSIFSSSLFLDVTFCKAGFALTYILITYILKEYINSLFIYIKT